MYDVLGEESMALIRRMSAALRGKTTVESLDIILKFMPEITAGRKFNDDERRLVIAALKEGMNDTERMRLDEIMAVMGIR